MLDCEVCLVGEYKGLGPMMESSRRGYEDPIHGVRQAQALTTARSVFISSLVGSIARKAGFSFGFPEVGPDL